MENISKKNPFNVGANLTPFEKADKKLIAFAERAIGRALVEGVADRPAQPVELQGAQIGDREFLGVVQ
mgnify:CR=1 FL=1